MNEILTYCNDRLKLEEFYKSQEKATAYLIDLIALIRTIAGLGSTYEELTLKVLGRLPKNYDRIAIVADTYRQNSLKTQNALDVTQQKKCYSSQQNHDYQGISMISSEMQKTRPV